MFHLSPEVNPKEHYINGVKVRDVAKTINFGLAYGMGAQGLANRVKGCSLEQARTLMRTYFNTYKDVEKYLKVSGHTGVSRGYALSLAGRRRNFSQEELSNPALRGAAERSAKNHPIQATNADILKSALALLSSKLPDDAHIVMTIHDELVLECPVELQDEVAKLLQSCLYEACTMFLKRVHIPEEKVLISPFWKKD
ncbi:MAG: hypothetical protein E6J34_00310 [Chloroflexi bacterium]|nr:MAG: hypothetical protein E6J34_00310 [Chloroflexota bacterium]